MAKKNYENFPLSLAFFDALPVLFFGIAVLLIAIRFENILFITGAFLCTLAGLGKVIWKIIIARTQKDIVWMNRQLRVLMPVGFLLIFAGLWQGRDIIHLSTLWQQICTFPTALFFGITVVGMVCMSVFAVKLDGTKLRSNWIEQITNAIAQGCFLLGVLSLL